MNARRPRILTLWAVNNILSGVQIRWQVVACILEKKREVIQGARRCEKIRLCMPFESNEKENELCSCGCDWRTTWVWVDLRVTVCFRNSPCKQPNHVVIHCATLPESKPNRLIGRHGRKGPMTCWRSNANHISLIWELDIRLHDFHLHVVRIPNVHKSESQSYNTIYNHDVIVEWARKCLAASGFR
jgi:hypothetical protein